MKTRHFPRLLFSMLAVCLVAGGLMLHNILLAHAATISASSSIENIRYDLGNIKLSLEKIDSRMRISPSADGKLLIENVRAKRLTIQISGRNDSAAGNLPDSISLPVAIQVKTASIAEVLIVQEGQTRILDEVSFNLDADDKQLRLELTQAGTPWGALSGKLLLENAKPFALNGIIELKQTDSAHPYDIALNLAGNLERLRFDSSAALVREDHRIALHPLQYPATAEQLIGKLQLSGSVGLSGDMPLEAGMQLLQLAASSPGAVKTSALNLDMLLSGKLSPEPQLQLTLQSQDSRWQGEPLAMQASARLAGSMLEQVALEARLQNNLLQANGTLGSTQQALNWQARLDDLSALDADIAGRMDAKGQISGDWQHLAFELDWLAEQLLLADKLQIGRLSGKMAYSSTAASLADIEANDMRLNNGAPFDAMLSLRGTRQKHRIELKTSEASGNAALHGLIDGGFENGAWLALLEKFSYSGGQAVALEKSARLRFDSRNGFGLENLLLRFNRGRLQIDHLQAGNGRFSTQGRIASLGLRELPAIIFTMPDNIEGDPVFSGDWQIAAEHEVNGQANLKLESGDIGIRAADGSFKSLGLQTLNLALALQRNQVEIKTEASGNQLGKIRALFNSELQPTASGFSLAASSPLKISADGNLQTLLWLPMPESLSGATLDGQIEFTLRGDGSISAPGLQGTVKGRQLAFAIPGEGVNLQDGTLNADFSNDRLAIRQAAFTGGKGRLHANGHLQLAQGQPELSLDWHAENFTAVSRTDRLIVIEGDVNTTLSSNLLEIAGQIDIVSGIIELAGEDKPTLGDDVVILGREEESGQTPLLMKISDLKIAIGNRSGKQFALRGRGLDSTLNGTITLNGLPGQALRADGNIVAAGTYMAYGQVLKIERGQLNFSGPADNPGLDILALRQNVTVRAGVEIRGSVLSPAIRLVSIPEVSDSEKLSWLVFGHGMDQVGKDQFAILSLAAGALLSQGQSVPLQTSFARAAGLDSFNIGGSDTENVSFNLGKRLAPNLYLSYEKEVNGLLNVARLTYDITKRWSLRTQAGSESAVDVLYTFSFR
ncbi:MAG: hypothetical protein RL194_660 [Pseudomonadota bacterium]